VSTIAGRSVSGQPPRLIRSATDTLLHEMQREKSNSPLVNLNSSTRSFSRSSSINHGKMVKEIDVNAPVHLEADKPKKTVDQELRDAIATLKKPNRGLAVKEYADATESRKLGTQKRPQTSRTQSRVDATPHRAAKTKDAINATPRRGDAHSVANTEHGVPSSMPFVPSSAHRPVAQVRQARSPEPPSGPALLSTSRTIMETPSKPSGRYCDPLGIMHEDTTASAGTFLAEVNRPLPSFKVPAPKQRVVDTRISASTIPNTPQKSRRRIDVESSKAPSRARSPEPIVLLSSPVAVRHSAPAKDRKHGTHSIYDSLGWDDENIM
jgi:DNA replication regulator SLD3